jgi:hypothetical protein
MLIHHTQVCEISHFYISLKQTSFGGRNYNVIPLPRPSMTWDSYAVFTGDYCYILLSVQAHAILKWNHSSDSMSHLSRRLIA